MFFTLFALACYIALAVAAPYSNRVVGPAIEWTPCYNTVDDLNNSIPILCGKLAVPRDYTDPTSQSTVELPLYKVPAASNRPGTKTILVNFGGPGLNDTLGIRGFGGRLRGISGKDHDLVTWGPRGTHEGLRFSCYDNATSRTKAESNPLVGSASQDANSQLWDRAKSVDETCFNAQQGTGSLVGTVFTARDMMQIVDALGEDGLLRFWGISYGTVIGATAAILFPERMERVILDGVVNTQNYYHTYKVLDIDSVPDVVSGFCQGCLDHPAQCPLAGNFTAVELQQKLYDFMDSLRGKPIETTKGDGTRFTITYSLVKIFLFGGMYAPGGSAGWPFTARVMHGLMTGNYTDLIDDFANIVTPETVNESLQGVACGDTISRASELGELIPYLEEQFNKSRLAGDIYNYLTTECARWPFAAKERLDRFKAHPRYPPLLLSNIYDPATPLDSARNVSAALEGSVLVKQNGYGHTTLSQASLCTSRIVHAYFAKGTLPDTNTFCRVDGPVFSEDSDQAAWTYIARNLSSTS